MKIDNQQRLQRRWRNTNKSKLFSLMAGAAIGAIGSTLLMTSQAAVNPNLIGDLNGDNVVNLTDLSMLLANWGKTISPTPGTPTPNPPAPNPTPSVPTGSKTIWQDDFTSMKYTTTAKPKEYSIKLANGGPGHESVLRFEVRDGDMWSGGERAEVTLPSNTDIKEGDERWYEFDIRLGDPNWGSVIDEEADGTIVFQWHPEDQEASPQIALAASTNGKLRLRGGDEPPIEFWTIRPGVWERVVMHFKFTNSKSTGWAEVYVNGQAVVPKTPRRLMSDAGQYHKFGLYRDTDNTSTSVLMYDNLRISAP